MIGDRLTVQCRIEMTEEPRPTETASTDYDTVAPRLFHHVERVLGFPDVAVAEHRNLGHGLSQLGDGAPVRGS